MNTASARLRTAYSLGLILHALMIAALMWLAFVAAGGLGDIANAARETTGLSVALFLTGILPAIPSVIALLAWWFCRRNGWRPSAGHMGLAIAAAAGLAIILLMAWLS